MYYLSQFMLFFGGMLRNEVFKRIIEKIEPQKENKKNLFFVLFLRFCLHAHLYSPVLALIIIDITKTSNEKNSISEIAISLFLVSLGSFSFAVFDSIGGIFADNKGCKFAIRYGIFSMIVLMAMFSLIAFFSSSLGNWAFYFTVVIQCLIGIPLSLIDGADTVLTKKITKDLKVLTDEEEDHLEGFCTQLKYSGIAIASFVGCFLYVVTKYAITNNFVSFQITTLGAFLFLLTISSQIISLIWLIQINEPEKIDVESREILEGNISTEISNIELVKHTFASAYRTIFSDKVLLLWVLIIAVIEGWLLFSTNYFQLNALKDLINTADQSLILIIIIPFFSWILMQIATYGGSHFNRWLSKKSIEEKKSPYVNLRNESVLEIPRVRLIAACEIIGIMVIVYIIHLGISGFQTELTSEDYRYYFSFLPLIFFAIYQYLRGFSSPFLKTTLSNLASSNKLDNLTTTISLASSAGRLFHAITTGLFALCLWLLTPDKTSSTISQFTQALAATTVVIILALLLLNVLSSIALNKKEASTINESKSLRSEIIEIYKDKSFRLLLVKVSFVICLVMANVLGARISQLGNLTFDAGAIPYALTFLLVDTIAEIENKSSARKLWFSGVLSYFVVGFLIVIVLNLPIDSNATGTALNNIQSLDEAYKTHLGFLLASFCSFTVAQYIDIWLFTLLKNILKDQALWLRSNLTTFVSQAIDTVIFVTIAYRFMEGKTIYDVPYLVFGFLAVKWVFSLVSTPLLYGIVSWVEGGEKLR